MHMGKTVLWFYSILGCIDLDMEQHMYILQFSMSYRALSVQTACPFLYLIMIMQFENPPSYLTAFLLTDLMSSLFSVHCLTSHLLFSLIMNLVARGDYWH